MAKAAVAAIKGLISAIIAGGWVAVLIILIICMIGLLVGSVFGIFFSKEKISDTGKTINGVIMEIDTEFTDKIDSLLSANAHDLEDVSGARADWKEVLAVYTVKTVNDPDKPMDVATMDDEKAAILKQIFWYMNKLDYTVSTVSVDEDVLGEDGAPTGEKTTVIKTVLKITVSHKTTAEMAAQYGFSADQLAQLDELLKPDYYAMWNALLYGVTSIGDGTIVEVAASQIGNVGGEPYWSWYGFTQREEWCACFVSWCANQCGYIDAGIIPRFSWTVSGVGWFKGKGQWQNGGFTPSTGDIIFFDWDGDGVPNHVGIVESVADGTVHTIEGNSSDTCCRRSYAIGNGKILGYGLPVYQDRVQP